jgi:hypothetical protein
MKYHVYYVEGCSPKLKSFTTKKAMNKFIKEYEKSDDDWIDFTFKGEILWTEEHYELGKK